MVLKLIVKVLILVAVAWFFLEGIIWLNPYRKLEEETHFAAAMNEKQAALAKMPSPKLVLVAGSNFGYGIDSKMLQDSLGMPVMNMSFQYFLGTDFLIRQVMPQLRAGDILLMGFEYIADDKGNTKEKLVVQHFYPPAADWIDYDSPIDYIRSQLLYRIDYVRGILMRMILNINIVPTVEDDFSVFFRKAINPQGDLISHLNNPDIAIPIAELRGVHDMKAAIVSMNQYADILKKKGVKVFYTYPPYSESSYKPGKVFIDSIQFNFKKARFKIIDTPQTHVYPDSLFHDMAYHLNGKGRENRTQNLIKALKKQLN